MSSWPEDFSACTLKEVLGWQAENRAWNKELRLKTNSLVNSRLAKNISQDDYLATRKLVHEDAAECRRRANILDAQITRRTVGPMSRESFR
jgi:hypothetical protein